MSQLALWEDAFIPDDTPLPLLVAARWEFPLQYHVTGGKYRYALQDWIHGLTQISGKALWEQVRRLRNDPDCTLNVESEPYRATDGKTYKRPFVDDRSLYRSAQALRPLNSRERLPEVHTAIMEYLAAAGVLADQMRRDPEWAAARIEGMVSRKAMMAALREAVEQAPPWLYGAATNDVYRGLYHRDRDELAAQLETKNVRDKLSVPALRYLDIAEWTISQQIGDMQQIGVEQTRDIIQDIAGMIGVQVGEVEQRLGIDVVSGQKTLQAGG